jgi:hypothetical protein
MRKSHPGGLRFIAIGLVALGLGCASNVGAAFDEGADFSRFHTWDFAASEVPRVEAPADRQRTLDAQLSRLIVAALASRGYQRARERPDFLVSFQLSIQPRTEIVLVPRAAYLLSSHHSSPSYWIEGSDREERRFEELRLSIGVARHAGKLVWKAEMRDRLDNGGTPKLRAAVASLLKRFPRAAPTKSPRRPLPDRLARLSLVKN